jgi:hypothetical protein
MHTNAKSHRWEHFLLRIEPLPVIFIYFIIDVDQKEWSFCDRFSALWVTAGVSLPYFKDSHQEKKVG